MPTVNGHTVETGCYIDGGRDTPENESLRVVAIMADLISDPEITRPLEHEAEIARFRLRNAEAIGEADGNTDFYRDALASACEAVYEIGEDAAAVLNDHTEDGYWTWCGDRGGFFCDPPEIDPDGYICTTCLILEANGETDPDMSEAETAAYLEAVETVSSGGRWVSVCPEDGSCEGSFSWSACDMCGDHRGGSRHPAMWHADTD